VHFGVSRVLLLGYDMQTGPRGQQHWHADHPNKLAPSYDRWRSMFDSLVDPLKKAGVSVVNCTRRTALETFPCAPLESVL
jgi:hypothetical protein